MFYRDRSLGVRSLPPVVPAGAPDSIRGGGACPERVEGEESRRRRPELALQAEPGSLRSLRSVGMTEWDFAHVMKCNDSSRWPLPSLCCAARLRHSRVPPSRIDRLFYISCFFCTGLSVRSHIAGPDRRKQPAGAARRGKQICSYNVLLRASSSFFCGVSVRARWAKGAQPFSRSAHRHGRRHGRP